MNDSKVDAMSKWEPPRNVFEICSFLGLARYYHDY